MLNRRLFFTGLGACTATLLACDREAKKVAQSPQAQSSGEQTTTTEQPQSSLDKANDPMNDSSNTALPENTETALLAGGCFWGMEDILRKVPGILETEVGYTGGNTSSPTYNDVKMGSTGHAESVQIRFDPNKISYAEILENWFFRMHDPTTVDRQGNDRGSQYRSAIFYLNAEQKRVAEEVIAKVNKSGLWPDPIVTQVSEAGPFTPAEGYHQDYLEKNPGGYTCHFMRPAPVY